MAKAKKRGRKKQARRAKIPAGVLVFVAVVAALALLLALLLRALLGGGPDAGVTPAVSPTATVDAVVTATPGAATAPAATATPVSTVGPGLRSAGEVVSPPSQFGLESIAVQNGERVDAYARTPEIHMGLSGEYTDVEGVTTFRGNNYRDSAAYGNIPDDPEELEIVWSVAVSQIDDWGGVGWTVL